jgi:hypothetical protein
VPYRARFKLVLGADDSDEELDDLELDPLELGTASREEVFATVGDVVQDLRAVVRHASVQQTAANETMPVPVPQTQLRLPRSSAGCA